MNFIKYLDDQHITHKNNFQIPETQKDFISYYKLTMLENKNFIVNYEIRKDNKKTKLYIKSENQRVYLSDKDIIDFIVNNLSDKQVEFFIKTFVNLYQHVNTDDNSLNFKIEDNQFSCFGLPFSSQEKKFKIFSDTEVSINDFIFVVNFIISKDYYAGMMGKLDNNLQYLHQTLCKYIVLIGNVRFNNEHCINYLKEINYPDPEDKTIEDSYMLKKIFTKNNIEKFDINLHK